MSSVGAYVIGDGERAEVVFARNAMEARRIGAVELGGLCDETDYDYRRAPEYDDVTSVEELRRRQLADGWWFYCAWADCGKRVETDDDDYAYDADPPEPAIRDEHVYCSAWHAAAEAVRHVERRIRIWEAIGATMERFPGAHIYTVNDRSRGPHHHDNLWRARVCFRVPGVDCSIDWFVGDEHVELTECHVAAFEQYKRQRDAGEFK